MAMEARECKVLGSLAEAVKAQSSNEDTVEPPERDLQQASSLQMVSFTITEKGYASAESRWHMVPIRCRLILKNGPDKATGAMAVVVAMLV